MLIELADSVQADSDVLRITRNGKSLTLRRPNRAGMGDVAELMKVRSFLADSERTVPNAGTGKE